MWTGTEIECNIAQSRAVPALPPGTLEIQSGDVSSL